MVTPTTLKGEREGGEEERGGGRVLVEVEANGGTYYASA
jgi:hypothetical protein